jgi:carboxypeptidase family protein
MKSARVDKGFTAFRMILGLVASFAVGQSALVAQLTTATIQGTVKDQSGAVLPGATVTATNTETGNTRNATSGSRGEYRLSALGAGTYDIQAEMTGFQTGVRKGVTLTIGSEPVLDFSLSVGNVTEQVTVTGEAPLVEATTSTVSGVVDQQQMKDIPLNARSFIELVPLQTGAVFAQQGNSDGPTFGFGRKLSVVGTRFNSNSFLLDGADINNVGGTAGNAAGTVAGVETVREFRVITNAYDAQYGRHTGAVVSAITKSGTNQIHGSLFDFIRKDALDASLWEDNKFGNAKPPYTRNQFGGSVGGPLVKDRTFYFGSYEGLRDNRGQTKTINVPGVKMRENLASGAITVSPLSKPYLDKYLIYTPNVKCASNCFNPAQYPTDVNNSVAADTLLGFTTAGYQFPAETTTNDDFYTARVDHRISDADSIFVRYNQDSGGRNLLPDFNTHGFLKNTNRFTTIEETHIFSPALLAKTNFSFNRTRIGSGDAVNAGFEYPNGLTSFDGGPTPGRVSITGLSAIGGSATNPKDYVQNVFQTQEDMFWTRGSHSLKMGGLFERLDLNDTSGFHDGGTFTFSSVHDFVGNTRTPGGTVPAGYAGFFGPIVNVFDVTKIGSDNHRGSRQNLLGLYLQDDWNLRPGLTINMGLRYEIISSPKEVNGKVSNIRDITDGHIAAITPANVDIGDPYFLNPSLKNFAPRVGFAWDPFGKGKTSFRGGAGFYHDQLLAGEWRSPLGRSAPFYAVSEPTLATGGANGFPIDFPRAYFTQVATAPDQAAQTDGFEWNAKQPTVYKWSFSIQHEVLKNMTVEAGYSGTRSTHLVRASIQLNSSPVCNIVGTTCSPDLSAPGRLMWVTGNTNLPGAPVFPAVTNASFGRVRWRTTDGQSDYHGLRLQATKRFSKGLQVQSSYTFSKTLDDSSSYVGGTDINGSSDRGGVRRDKEPGPSAFDVRNAFTANFVYDLPGEHLAGLAGKLLGGWSVSSIVRLNNGPPMSLSGTLPRTTGGANLSNTGGSTLDLIAGGNQNPISGTSAGCSHIAVVSGVTTTVVDVPVGAKLGTPDQWYDACQFAYPQTNCINASNQQLATANCVAGLPAVAGILVGSVGRNHLKAPGLANVDFTLIKETKLTKIRENMGVEFRVEVFNLFNRVNFDQPSASLFDRSGTRQGAGQITATISNAPARQIQMAVRLSF